MDNELKHYIENGRVPFKVGDVVFSKQYSWPCGVTRFTVTKDRGTREYMDGELVQVVDVMADDGFHTIIWASRLNRTVEEAFNNSII